MKYSLLNIFIAFKYTYKTPVVTGSKGPGTRQRRPHSPGWERSSRRLNASYISKSKGYRKQRLLKARTTEARTTSQHSSFLLCFFNILDIVGNVYRDYYKDSNGILL
jgi:hypothetical protein